MFVVGLLIGIGWTLVIALLASKERSPKKEPAPDIFSPDLDRELVESVDGKCSLLLEELAKETERQQATKDDLQLVFNTLDDLLKRVISLEGKQSEVNQEVGYLAEAVSDLDDAVFPIPEPPSEASTCCSETICCYSVDGPLPTSLPVATNPTDWDEYQKLLAADGIVITNSHNQKGV